MKNLCLVVGLIFGCQPLLALAQQGNVYTFDAKLLSCTNSPTAIESVRLDTTTNGVKMMLSYTNSPTAIESERLEVITTTNGVKVMLFVDPSVLPTNCLCLTAPRITAAANQTAVVMVGGEEPQYFEKSVDGSYQLRQVSNANLGVRLTLTAAPGSGSDVVKSDAGNIHFFGHTPTRPGSGSDVVKLDAELQVGAIHGREKLPGVALDVGKPSISHQDTRLSISVKLGQWVGIMVPNSDPNANDITLFLLRVRHGEK